MAKPRKTVRRGELNKSGRLERPVGTISSTGGIVTGTPETIATGVPAAIEPVDVRSLVAESIASGGISNILTHVVKLDYRPDVSVSNRFYYYDDRRAVERAFEVMAVVNADEANIELQLLCAERVS